MDPLMHQFAERGIDFSLPLEPVQAEESGAFDDESKMAFAPGIMAGMAKQYTPAQLEQLADYLGSLQGELLTVSQPGFK